MPRDRTRTIFKRELGDPETLPPIDHVGYAGHHWVERIDFDGRPDGKIVLQWQPQARRWCLPNQYASYRDFDVTGYRYLAPCPMPLFERELMELWQTIRVLDSEQTRAYGAKEPMQLDPAIWDKLRKILYPLIP